MIGLFLDSFLRKSPPPSNMMVISRQPAYIPAEFSHFLNKLREKGYYIIFPFPLEEMASTHATPLAKNPVALEEDKSTETGEPPSWFCNVCHHFVAPGLAAGRGVDNFIRHLSTRDHARLCFWRMSLWGSAELVVEIGYLFHYNRADPRKKSNVPLLAMKPNNSGVEHSFGGLSGTRRKAEQLLDIVPKIGVKR
ncbi:unnamed protein product [Arabidopsis lyrata]|uniref:Uncharacterized protein n=1 Tax=Arabidopsis lyrata subsp. lyrata TaxID=81972 RepID=D7KF38_ARALL|nr:hypothetical protein ARALYDRAFT_887725 [Arabidopsis lyrata subsp. lyrata]CAH8251248.1 unnamed protein product [Arabidopsis lyrata]